MTGARRPTGVTIVAVIVLVNGLLTTIGAIIGLTGGGDTASSIVSLILGILTLLVAAGLFSRSPVARVLTTIVLALSLAGAIFGLGVTAGTSAMVWPIISGALSLIGIVLLYTRQANAYFR
ncbi:MAG TPA: hypothetical protein VNQ48_04700 [Microbacteriaceae bacterium]|nr:hypothetical protein [Microbacteriaceae bacterium]